MSQTKLDFGRCYHLYYQGHPGEAVFRLEKDYSAFLDLLQKYIGSIANLYAYCLLPSHFHLLLRIKDKTRIDYVYSIEDMLWVQFEYLFGVYTRYFNRSYQRSGCLIKGSSPREIPRINDLICELVVYIHQNPQIHGFISDFRYWPFSSCSAHLRQDRRSMIAKELLLDPDCHGKILNLQDEYLGSGILKKDSASC